MVEFNKIVKNANIDNILYQTQRLSESIVNLNFITLSKNNKSYLLLSIIVFIIFIGISIYIYINYIQKNIQKKYVDNREFIKEPENKITMFWFYTDWCPYCKTKKPIWDNFVTAANIKDYPIVINFKEINCDYNSNTADQYNIEENPNIGCL